MIARRQLPPTEPATYFWVTTALALDGIIRNDNRGSESLFPIPVEARELAYYAYALFHSPAYRQRYATALRASFPRVLQPRDTALAARLSKLGRQLVVLHTQPPPRAAGAQRLLIAIAPHFPQFHDGRVWIGDHYSIATADEAIWQFRIGAHQVARKWLADRRGRTLTETDLAWYEVILRVIAQTRLLAGEIDAAIEEQGGFPGAFASDGAEVRGMKE